MINTKDLATAILLFVVILILAILVMSVVHYALDARLARWDRKEKMKIEHRRLEKEE